MKRVLFIDRDGTLIVEPPEDFQVDSLEKLAFTPGVLRNMYNLRMLDAFEMVIVSNQDAMGTELYPEEDFRVPHEKFLQTFKNEGIIFDRIHIDPSHPDEKSPNRKPQTGMLGQYITGDYDLASSYVIGDRLTDLELAQNLGSKGIFYGPPEAMSDIEAAGLDEVCILISNDWDEIYGFIRSSLRKAEVKRKTGETDVFVSLSLDGSGKGDISTGLGFFDHMLDQIARHGNFDLTVKTVGDLHVDEHHTIEDTGLALGEAILRSIGDKRGINRYGFLLPMDETLAQVALDLGGRPELIWKVDFQREKIGDVPTEMFYHFFKSLCDTAKMNLNISVEGVNEHHKIEAVYKSFARALRMAVAFSGDSDALPSTKGAL